jgi:AcrR family transcriptional regulator
MSIEMPTTQEKWIKAGYELFANFGEKGLKIETMAQKMGISKSSFYHHFAALDLFLDELLNYHLLQSKRIAEKESLAYSINPDLINILVEHKTDLLFNRQLRFNQQKETFKKALVKSNQSIGNEFVILWAKEHKLSLSQKQLESLFELALENFFLQINEDNLNFTWLYDYFNKLGKIAQEFQ